MASAPIGPPSQVAWRPNPVAAEGNAALIELLDRSLGPNLQPTQSTLTDPDRATSNYGETLPKVMNNRTVILNRPRTKAYRAAKEVGLVDLLHSTSTRQLAEHLTGSPHPEARTPRCLPAVAAGFVRDRAVQRQCLEDQSRWAEAAQTMPRRMISATWGIRRSSMRWPIEQ